MNTDQPFSLRELTPDDAAAWREIRLQALEEKPEAFGSSYEEFRQTTVEEVAERFQTTSTTGDNFIMGAWDEGGRLVGTVGFYRAAERKARHLGTIWGVYVVPEARGTGIAKRLMAAALERLEHTEGLVQVELGVSTTNTPALRLYLSLGFTIFGTEPRALNVNGTYYDEHLMVRMLD